MSMQTRADAIIHGENDYLLNTYSRPPFVLVHGEGMTLFDTEGRAYQDWVSGIAVNALGYGDAGLMNAIQQQLATGMLHVSNLYHTAPHVEVAQLLVARSFADRVYFCNSGAEANEGALKFARKRQYKLERYDKTQIVTFTDGFHGRTMGALAATPREKYQKPFAPLMPGVVVAEFNNIDSAKAAIGPQTAAVIVEPVQGEGGVNPAEPAFLQALRELCDEHDAALIFDEVQCGVGRTGTLWAHEQSGVVPDMMTLAKPLAGGLPVGAVLVNEKIAAAIEPGDHGSTFAGGPMVMAAAREVLTRIGDEDFLEQVRETGAYLMERLSEINSPHIQQVRGRGLMVGIALDVSAKPLVEAGYEAGLLMVSAGADVLRLVPPLIATKSDVDTLVDRLTDLFAAL